VRLKAVSCGASRRQGTHHEPQKLMKTGLPCSFASENGLPANDVPVIGAAA
jgi:hypothetical protein